MASQFPGEARLPQLRTHKVRLADGGVTLCFEIPSADTSSPLVIMGHGMGGCSHSGYMKRIGKKLNDHGFPVFLLNQRGSGAGIGMSERLWNGGSSDDFSDMVEHAMKIYPKREVLLIGFSLSGNILLKYLGEGREISRWVRGAFAVNPPVDLKMASRLISTSSKCKLFNRYYMRLINQQAEAIKECFAESFRLDHLPRTIWEFDVSYTAPAGGFEDVDDYYTRSSCGQFLASIQIPTTLLCSNDDPFIPIEIFKGLELSHALDLQTPEGGGHMGYLCKETTPFDDHRWMDWAIIDWAMQRKTPL
ncbi:MAG: alpha/beta fold hydrolase [Candidatus Nitrohelix vancouverensis]|uniref:Alpha/beta fold hydrolase n=1 Tax=Candidatus Nitrohelix vancouverensis TaxID=2705534 RepID=A0A7T0G487_9BACT|nr:MAG: alpha/beta fold hydrolase [Candidatus Nitrohelix vancouverensis]